MIKITIETDCDHRVALNGISWLMDIAGSSGLDDPDEPVNVLIDAFADAIEQYEQEAVGVFNGK